MRRAAEGLGGAPKPLVGIPSSGLHGLRRADELAHLGAALSRELVDDPRREHRLAERRNLGRLVATTLVAQRACERVALTGELPEWQAEEPVGILRHASGGASRLNASTSESISAPKSRAAPPSHSQIRVTTTAESVPHVFSNDPNEAL